MANDPLACPMPHDASELEERMMRRVLTAQRIAVVGISAKPQRPSHYVAQYLMHAGKTVLPVHPGLTEVLGLQCYPSLEAVPGPIDLVDVFRRADACADVVRQAIAVGARGVWLQAGIVSEEAERLAMEAGLDFIQNRCLMVELGRHG